MNLRVVFALIGAVLGGALVVLFNDANGFIFGAFIGGVIGLLAIWLIEYNDYIKHKDKTELTINEYDILSAMLKEIFPKYIKDELDLEKSVFDEPAYSHYNKFFIDDYLVTSLDKITNIIKTYVYKIKIKHYSNKEMKPSQLIASVIKDKYLLGYVFGAFESMLESAEIGEDCDERDAAKLITMNYQQMFGKSIGLIVLEVTLEFKDDEKFCTGRQSGRFDLDGALDDN